MEMKKKLLLCVSVFLIVFEATARVSQNQSSLIDFLIGRSRVQDDQPDSGYNDKENDDVKGLQVERSSYEQDKSTKNKFVTSEDSSLLSDESAESSKGDKKKSNTESSLQIGEEPKEDEVFINSFRGVTNLADLFKNIRSNVEGLTFGRMSNDDYNKLVQRKEKIFSATKQYTNATLAYDKICAMEQILMDYNAISEISVHFLSDIGKQEINKVQNALFLTEIDSLSAGLTYTFKTPVSRSLQNSISKIHLEIKNFGLKEFCEKLVKEIGKIPQELLEPAQYAKVEYILKKIHKPIVGKFEEKCKALKSIVESYNDLKSIPFRLRKISSDSMKKLSIRAIEDIFFEKMLNILRIMDEEHYSITAENDAEALAARNIKKSMCKMLGGTSYSGKEYKSNIELFRMTNSLQEKQRLLKDSIAQFNKAVDLFKIAVSSLKEEGRRSKLKNIDAVNTINEDIDKIFEKIAIYSSNVGKENQKRTLDKDEEYGEVSDQEELNIDFHDSDVQSDNKDLKSSTITEGNEQKGIEDFAEDLNLEEMEKAFKESEVSSEESLQDFDNEKID